MLYTLLSSRPELVSAASQEMLVVKTYSSPYLTGGSEGGTAQKVELYLLCISTCFCLHTRKLVESFFHSIFTSFSFFFAWREEKLCKKGWKGSFRDWQSTPNCWLTPNSWSTPWGGNQFYFLGPFLLFRVFSYYFWGNFLFLDWKFSKHIKYVKLNEKLLYFLKRLQFCSSRQIDTENRTPKK